MLINLFAASLSILNVSWSVAATFQILPEALLNILAEALLNILDIVKSLEPSPLVRLENKTLLHPVPWASAHWQQTRNLGPMLGKYWACVEDAALTLEKYWVKALCLPDLLLKNCEWKSISPNRQHSFKQWKFNVGQRHTNLNDLSLSYVFDPNSRMLHLGGMWGSQHRSGKLPIWHDTLAQRWFNAGSEPGECLGCGGSVSGRVLDVRGRCRGVDPCDAQSMDHLVYTCSSHRFAACTCIQCRSLGRTGRFQSFEKKWWSVLCKLCWPLFQNI